MKKSRAVLPQTKAVETLASNILGQTRDGCWMVLTCASTHVPGHGVHKIRLEDVSGDIDDIVRIPGDDNGLLTDSCAADFGWDGPTELAR